MDEFEKRDGEVRSGPGGRRFGRRGLIAGGLGALAASLFGRAKPAEAVEVPPFALGQLNVATALTTIEATGPGIQIRSGENAFGALARSGFGAAAALIPGEMVYSLTAFPGGFGAEGWAAIAPTDLEISLGDAKAGLGGFSRDFGGLFLGVTQPTQFQITSTVPTGVFGAGGRVGVLGSAQMPMLPMITDAAGVLGTASDPETAAILAWNPQGIGLKVVGDVMLSGVIKGMIPAGEKMVEIQDPAVHADSAAIATLVGNPGNFATVHYLETEEGLLRVVLTAPTRNEVGFGALVLHGC